MSELHQIVRLVEVEGEGEVVDDAEPVFVAARRFTMTMKAICAVTEWEPDNRRTF